MTRPLAEQLMKAELLAQGLKFCTKCEDTKSVEEFGPRPKNSDGLECWCKACRREYQCQQRKDNPEKARARDRAYRQTPQYRAFIKRYREENEERLRVYRHQYYEGNKEIILEQCREYYYENRDQKCTRAKVYRQERKKERNEYNKEWCRRNPDKVREQKQRCKARHLEEYLAKDRERTKRYRQNNPEIVAASLARYRARRNGADGYHTDAQWFELLKLCYNRCVACGVEENVTRDHLVPLSWGGSDYLANIQPLCHKCNSKKQDLYAIDYRPAYVRAWSHFQSYPQLENTHD